MVLRRNTIPENIRKAARRAGLGMPHGYVGRNNGHHAHKRKNTVASIIKRVNRAVVTRDG